MVSHFLPRFLRNRPHWRWRRQLPIPWAAGEPVNRNAGRRILRPSSVPRRKHCRPQSQKPSGYCHPCRCISASGWNPEQLSAVPCGNTGRQIPPCRAGPFVKKILPRSSKRLQIYHPLIPLREMRYDPFSYSPFRSGISDYCFHVLFISIVSWAFRP